HAADPGRPPPRPVSGRAELVRDGRYTVRDSAPPLHDGRRPTPFGGIVLRRRLPRAPRPIEAGNRRGPPLLPRPPRSVPCATRAAGAVATRSVPDRIGGRRIGDNGGKRPMREPSTKRGLMTSQDRRSGAAGGDETR